jgi:hypothetical protein
MIQDSYSQQALVEGAISLLADFEAVPECAEYVRQDGSLEEIEEERVRLFTSALGAVELWATSTLTKAQKNHGPFKR